ncbi:MAG: hypothetical protein DIZ80_01510 [endosymbiont of Galathealinum brachiosum]|uniref:Uncharacterized protein n=1 Tax=endosymbiont of Galathealinum brachiosum TaxID=2200906 RepID=A0A370DMM3_9GAMM|nr:MAG: hypothetical protein DIZ80_01510 [endosymbiont of Galathealinum brachiosum]
MKNTKSIFQKTSFVVGIISFILAIACVVGLYLKIETHSINDPIAVAFLASTFFFISVGFVLVFISKMNIPSFDMQIESQDKG